MHSLVKLFYIVANKSLESEFREFGKTAHFGNLRGLNEFQEMDTIVIIGTYAPNNR